MSVKKQNVELSSDIDFIETPAAKPSEFETGEDCGIALTKVSSFCPIASFSKAC
jgi:cyclopropane-fatty-acyl-phospholipid synthase